VSERIRATILDLALRRGREKSLCPSEVAKALSEDWRSLMPEVRAVAAAMPEIIATQGGMEVDPVTARGPIRLRLRWPLANPSRA
jgi:hypothetical protein